MPTDGAHLGITFIFTINTMKQSTIDRATLSAAIEHNLKQLKKDRDREILRRRHGVSTTNDYQTLEQIGQDLGITRERVRQIEKSATNRIRQNHSAATDVHQKISEAINSYGGVICFGDLCTELNLAEADQAYLALLLKLNPDYDWNDQIQYRVPLVVDLDNFSPQQIAELHDQLVAAITEINKPSKFATIAGRIDGPHQEKTLQQIATAANKISQFDDHWGLSKWPEVNPKSIRDKIFLVLKKAGRPMHFTEIANAISKLKANPKKVTTQAVHNELIKDKRFVLIGRGIYALTEWGYQAGTVADIIEEVLREESPLSRDEIVRRVLARRQVKASTIVLNLQEKPQFERVDKGVYQLASK